MMSVFNTGSVRTAALALAPAAALLLFLVACNETGISRAPRATFVEIACLDVNGDGRLNAADATDRSEIPDFNDDGERGDYDAAFVEGVDIPLGPDACPEDREDAPEFAVARWYLRDADVDCSEGTQAVLLLGIGGGVVNLRDETHAAGVRNMVDRLQRAYLRQDFETLVVLAGPAVNGAQNGHAAMEEWLANAVSVFLDRFDCLRAVLLGHSHGAVTAEVVGARLEADYADRFEAVVSVDRVLALYEGDAESRPSAVRVVNVFQTNDGLLQGEPYDSPNAVNLDVSGELAPEEGEQGGELQPVSHTTIDNSDAVADIIAQELAGET